MRPTKYLRWPAVDRALVEGHLVLEGSRGSHGLPWHVATDPDREFEVDEVLDRAGAVLEEAEAEMRKADGADYGVRLVVLDQGVPGEQAQREG